MNPATSRAAILAVLVVCASACSSPESRFTAPTPTPPPVAAASPAPAPAPQPPPLPIPPQSGPSRVYDFAAPLTGIVAAYTRASRYVLYDNGAFELRYFPFAGSYRGRYEQAGDVVTFFWEGSSGAWGASASLSGDTLTVRYNLNMQMSDFEDAVYQLQAPN